MVITVMAPAALPASADDGHSPLQSESGEPMSGVISPFFNESGACDDAAGVIVPASTTNSLPNRALPPGHQVRGPWADFFGRDYADVSGSMVWWTVPMSGGKQVRVHQRALPAFLRVSSNLAAEAAQGRNYTARLVGSWVWRRISGRYQMSTHAFGATIDINWDTNPYQEGDGLISDMPGWYVSAWEEAGFCWGGDWTSAKDPMHFSWKGPISTPGYGSLPAPYPARTAPGDFTKAVVSKVADFGEADGDATYQWADGTRDGVADLYRIRSAGVGSTLMEVAQAAYNFRWCSIRSHVVPGADLATADEVVVADTDGDSRPDLTLVDAKDGQVRLRRFTYEGGYNERKTGKTGHSHADGYRYLFGDHDRDGLPDLYVIEPGSDTRVFVYSGVSRFKSRVFSARLAPNTRRGVWQFELGDLDVDGVPDLFMIEIADSVRLRIFDGAVQLGGGAEKFTTGAPVDLGGDYGVTDWDGDGRPDLISHKTSHRVKVHLGGVQDGDVDFWFRTPEMTCAGSGTAIVGDFNGDRRSDLAVGVPGERLDGHPGTGAAAVIYSRHDGPDATFKDQLWAAGTAHDSDGRGARQFGFAVATGDFNGDGFQDLAIGSPRDRVSGNKSAGSVAVIYGTEDGLRQANSQRWHQDLPGVRGNTVQGDRFGAALATGDFDADGFADLAVGVPGKSFGENIRSGKVHVLYGAPSGLVSGGDQLWSQASSGVPGAALPKDGFGSALVTGDFDGDGHGDLAIGAPRDDRGGRRNVGSATILFGHSSGLGSAGSEIWWQSSPGVPGAIARGDRFGEALAIGDFDGDSFSDLAVGVPGDDRGGAVDAGAVNILYGWAGGLDSTRSRILFQGADGLVGTAENGDLFGSALSGADFDGDGYFDLAIGVPGENQASGQVGVVYGSAGGLVPSSVQRWSESSSGIPGAKQADARFGEAVSVGDYDGDGSWDLAVAIPGQAIGGDENAGMVLVIFGSPEGLVAEGSRVVHQASRGVKDHPEAGDDWGRLP